MHWREERTDGREISFPKLNYTDLVTRITASHSVSWRYANGGEKQKAQVRSTATWIQACVSSFRESVCKKECQIVEGLCDAKDHTVLGWWKGGEMRTNRYKLPPPFGFGPTAFGCVLLHARTNLGPVLPSGSRDEDRRHWFSPGVEEHSEGATITCTTCMGIPDARANYLYRNNPRFGLWRGVIFFFFSLFFGFCVPWLLVFSMLPPATPIVLYVLSMLTMG
jgi:hypothetical protein